MLITRLPTPLLAATVLFLSSAAARFPNDFSPYPARARTCLENADADSGCDGNTVPSMNACLCADGGSFLTNSARCIGQESPSDLRAVYTLLEINCDGSNTPMDMSEQEFRSIASEDESSSSTMSTSTSTTTSSKPTETATGEPTKSTDVPSKPTETADEEDDGDEDAGLSTGATIGIAVAATGVGVGLIAAAIFMFLRRRRLSKAGREEANPMLGGGNGGNGHLSLPASTVYNPHGSPTYQDHLSAGKMGSPGIQAWGPDSFIAAAGPTPPPQHEQQQQQQQQYQHEQQRWSQASPPPLMQQQQMHPQQWDQSRPTSWDPQSRASWGGAHPQQGYQPAVPAAGSQVMPAAQLAPPAVGEVFELASTPRGYQRVAPAEMPGSQP